MTRATELFEEYKGVIFAKTLSELHGVKLMVFEYRINVIKDELRKLVCQDNFDMLITLAENQAKIMFDEWLSKH